MKPNDASMRQNGVEQPLPDASQFVDEKRVREVAGEVSSDVDLDEAQQPRQKNGATVHQSAYGDHMHRLNGAVPSNTAPLSSAEMEDMGIRKAGDFSHIREDAFEVPFEYRKTDAKSATKSNGKRARFDTATIRAAHRKRRRLIDGEDLTTASDQSDSEPGTDFDVVGIINENRTADDEFRSGQARAAYSMSKVDSSRDIPDGSQRSTLSFPVVKDPNDANTILRLSQGSTPSQKLPKGLFQRTPEAKLAPPKTPFKTPLSLTRSTPRTGGTTPGSKLSVPTVTGLKMLRRPVPGNEILCFQMQPPRSKYVETTMSQSGLPNVIYQDAYYSVQEDVPDRPRDYAGKEFKLESTTVAYLPEFEPSGTSPATFGQKQPIMLDEAAEENADDVRRRQCHLPLWSVAKTPPRRAEVVAWLREDRKRKHLLEAERTAKPPSQIEGPTQKNKHGFKYSQKQADTSVQHETQYMSLMSLEIHVNTRGKLAPNPEEDEVACVFLVRADR